VGNPPLAAPERCANTTSKEPPINGKVTPLKKF
jgi:hypothetical protein